MNNKAILSALVGAIGLFSVAASPVSAAPGSAVFAGSGEHHANVINVSGRYKRRGFGGRRYSHGGFKRGHGFYHRGYGRHHGRRGYRNGFFGGYKRRHHGGYRYGYRHFGGRGFHGGQR